MGNYELRITNGVLVVGAGFCRLFGGIKSELEPAPRR